MDQINTNGRDQIITNSTRQIIADSTRQIISNDMPQFDITTVLRERLEYLDVIR